MEAKDTFFYLKKTLDCRGRLLHLDQPRIMGILNVTPDSFFDGNRWNSPSKALKKVEKMLAEGADIIDAGGYSSRPGASHVSESEELQRVIPVIREISKKFPETILSIDTFRAKVAYEAVQEGASLVNDISAGSIDRELINTVASMKVPYVLMHMQGTPQTMQQNPKYSDVVKEINEFFFRKIPWLKEKGIEQLILDPGFGFGKTITHNFQLLENFETFCTHGFPVLAGLSRKSFIYKSLGTDTGGALEGTIAANKIAIEKGASVVRVHDVKETRTLIDSIE